MESFSNLLFRLSIVVWAAYKLSEGFDLLVRQFRFEGNNFGNVLEYFVWGLLTIVFGWRYLRLKRSALESRVMSAVWQRADQLFPVLRPIRCGFVWVCSLLVIPFICCTSCECWGNSCRALATLSDTLGQYELAEQFYRLGPAKESVWSSVAPRGPNLSSSAVWRCSNVRETGRQRVGRNRAVSTVYGTGSVEMARRYQFLADNLNFSGSNDLEATRSFYQKAQSIYHQHGLHGRCGEMLIERYLTYDPSDLQYLDLLRQAAYELSLDLRIQRPWLPGLAQWSANHAGDRMLAQRFHVYDLKYKDLQDRNQVSPVVESVVIYMATLLMAGLAVRTGLGLAVVAEFMIGRMYRKSRVAASSAPSLGAQIEAYTKLIDLDMYKGDCAMALFHSQEMLHRLDVSVSTIPVMRISFSRWSRVAMDQARAAALVFLFATIFR